MKSKTVTILTSVLVGSLLTTLALAQQPSQGFGWRGWVHNIERRRAQTATPATPNLMAYAINIAFEFGAVDLRGGAFLPIGPGLPPDVGDGLVQGPGTSLLSLGFEGNLVAIDPATGQTSVVGATGLGDCSTPVSPCGPNSALWIGLVDGHYYVTDFANNLYSLDPMTGATRLIGPTVMPGLTTPPFSENADGSVNVFGAEPLQLTWQILRLFRYSSCELCNRNVHPVDSGHYLPDRSSHGTCDDSRANRDNLVRQ